MEAYARQWAERLSAPAFDPPLDFEPEDQALETIHTLEGSNTISVSLDEGLTRQLLREAPAAYRAHINDLLLAALAQALHAWCGGPAWVDLEGHGRDALFEDIDLSRTLGWFTSLYPVLPTVAEGGPGETLKAVKSHLRGLPGGALRHGQLRYLHPEGSIRETMAQAPRPRISFNYLGQVEAGLAPLDGLVPARESCGPSRHPASKRTHWLELVAQVADDRLQMAWAYHERLHRRETIALLAQAYIDALQTLIEHCLQPENGGASPEDFPLATIRQEQLDHLLRPASWREVEDLYPLSPLQQGFLFHELYQPEQGAYFNQLSGTLHGPLRLLDFQQSWRDTLSHHPILRSAFYWVGLDQPVQMVWREAALPIQVEDWRGEDEERQQERLKVFLQKDREQGFDLERPPLMRLALLRIEEEAWFFVWSFHHLLLDGWCSGLLIQEIWQRYAAAGQHTPASLPAARPYRDFIAWLSNWDQAAAQSFWRETLRGFHAPTPLHEPLQRRDEDGFDLLETVLAKADTRRIEEYAREQKVTLNTLVQAVWALVLARYSGEEDVLFGITVAGRPPQLVGVESMLGLFINSLPLRLRVPLDATPYAWLPSIQSLNTAMREYEQSSLVDVAGWSDVPRGTPLFETLMVFENYPVAEAVQATRDTLLLTDIQFDQHTNYPLSLRVVPGERLSITWTFDRARIDAETMNRLAGHFRGLLLAMADQPETRLGDLPLLTDRERQRLLAEWNPRVDAASLGGTIDARVWAWAERRPDGVALVWEDESGAQRHVSYAALEWASAKVAQRLQTRGVRQEEPVGLFLERSDRLAVAMLACFRLGSPFVALDPDSPAGRNAWVADHCRLGLLLTRSGLESRAPAGIERLHLDMLEGEPTAMNPLPNHPNPNPAALAYLAFTSGSTGRPKGILTTRGGVSAYLDHLVETYRPTPEMVVLQLASPVFDASIRDLIGPLRSGARVAILAPHAAKEPAALLRAMSVQRVSALWSLVPSQLRSLAEVAPLVADHPPALELLLFSGERLTRGDVAKARALFGKSAILINQYGPSECTMTSSYQRVEASAEDARGQAEIPIGGPIPSAGICLLDRRLQPLPMGITGEIFLAGAGLARGYFQLPRLTAAAFSPHPFASRPGERLYRSGDRARRNLNGQLEYRGRSDQQIKLRGNRVEPGEIEALLCRHPAISQAVVTLAGGKGKNDPQLIAHIVIRQGESADETALRDFAATELPEYMLPGRFRFAASLPRTATGKLDRTALARMGLDWKPDTARLSPRTPTEAALVNIWEEALGIEGVGVRDNFFALGGHSLLATRVISRIWKNLGLSLPVRLLFEAPTIAQLAERVDAAARKEQRQSQTLAPAPRDQPLPLSFAQQRLWFLDRLEGPSATYNMPSACKLSGLLDPAALIHSFTKILNRHEVLRTRFAEEDGHPVQIIGPPAGLAAPVIDLRGLAARDPRKAKDQARWLAREEAHRHFDLARGPLMRVALIRVLPEEAVTLITVHHIAADAWSMGVLVHELAEMYRARLRGSTHPLPDLPIQYADFAWWQRQWLSGGELERQLGYWQERLDGLPPLLELPSDRPRPKTQGYRGAQFPVSLPEDLSHTLADFCRERDLTLFMALNAAFQLLCARYSGQQDVAVGLPVANRTRPEVEPLIGFFVNTLVLRAQISAGQDIEAYLADGRRLVLDALAHQDVPFELVVDRLQPVRDLSFAPLVQVTFVLQNAPVNRVSLPGMELMPLDQAVAVSRFDLNVLDLRSANSLAQVGVRCSRCLRTQTP